MPSKRVLISLIASSPSLIVASELHQVALALLGVALAQHLQRVGVALDLLQRIERSGHLLLGHLLEQSLGLLASRHAKSVAPGLAEGGFAGACCELAAVTK